MSRQLYKRQKKAIDKVMEHTIIRQGEDMTTEDYKRIEDMNPHETFWSNLNRYIHDRIMDGCYDGKWETLPKSTSCG